MTFAVIKTGGKQYLVRENDELYIDKLSEKQGDTVSFPCLLLADDEAKSIQVGQPFLEKKIQAKVLEHLKGKKVRILRFKAKSRYRKRKGFRPHLSKIKILSFADIKNEKNNIPVLEKNNKKTKKKPVKKKK